MKIARCTPSRGLIHSRTEEMAEMARMAAEAHGNVWRSFFTHDLPIPDCFNRVCRNAYDWGADLFWILEEDIQLSYAIADLMGAIADGADVAVMDYPMDVPGEDKITWGVVRDGAGRIAWCRTGCILFRRKCLDAMPEPWFTLRGRIVKPGIVEWQSEETSGYGADVGFTSQLIQLGFKIHEVDIPCRHLRVVEMGQSGVNSGCHRIEALPGPERKPHTPPRRKH